MEQIEPKFSNANKLQIEVLADGKFLLIKDYFYRDFYGKTYKVDKGFITDLASVPRFFWRYIAPTDIPFSAVIHDDLLARLCDQKIKNRFKRFAAWKQANAIMVSAMALSPRKIPFWRKSMVKLAIDLNATIRCVIFNKHPKKI